MATIKKRFCAIMCAALMTSFFPTHAYVEQETEKNDGPGWGYYTAKVGLHAAGLVASFLGRQESNELNNYDWSTVICHGAGFGLPFFYRNMQLLKWRKRDIRDRIGTAMNLWSFGIHLWGISTVCGAGKKWEDADCKIGDSEQIGARRRSIKDVGFGALLHLIAGFFNEYGSSMMEEKKGLKVTLKIRGFEKKTEHGQSTLKNGMRKSRKDI